MPVMSGRDRTERRMRVLQLFMRMAVDDLDISYMEGFGATKKRYETKLLSYFAC